MQGEARCRVQVGLKRGARLLRDCRKKCSSLGSHMANNHVPHDAAWTSASRTELRTLFVGSARRLLNVASPKEWGGSLAPGWCILECIS